MGDTYGAVVFDFFGTLTEAVTHNPTVPRVARALGCDPVAFRVLLERTYPARVRGELGDARNALRWIAWQLGHTPSAAQVSEAVRLRTQGIRGGLHLRQDAICTLWTLRSHGLRTALVSDCTDELPGLVAQLPVARLLDATVFSIQLGIGKPAVEVFLTACHRLGVEPSRCLYVGDGDGHELSGARTAGMTAVRLAAPDLTRHMVFNPEPEWTGYTVASLSAVIDIASPSAILEAWASQPCCH